MLSTGKVVVEVESYQDQKMLKEMDKGKITRTSPKERKAEIRPETPQINWPTKPKEEGERIQAAP